MPDATQAPAVRRFGAFEVNLQSGELRKNGMRLRLSGQPFQILAVLLERGVGSSRHRVKANEGMARCATTKSPFPTEPLSAGYHLRHRIQKHPPSADPELLAMEPLKSATVSEPLKFNAAVKAAWKVPSPFPQKNAHHSVHLACLAGSPANARRAKTVHNNVEFPVSVKIRKRKRLRKISTRAVILGRCETALPVAQKHRNHTV
jgi:hypothetical protein